MDTRLFTNKDYDMLSSWWAGNEMPVVHLSQLQTTGVIGYAKGEPACCMFAYKCEDVAIAFLDHFIVNPFIDSMFAKLGAIQSMMDEMLSILKEEGYQLIRAVTWSNTFGKVCKKRWGFELIDDRSVNMSLML